MATGAKGLPRFLSEKHLREWLTRSPMGSKLLDEIMPEWRGPPKKSTEEVSPAEWLRCTEEGRRMVAEAAKETMDRPRVLVVMYGGEHREVEVIAEGSARIKLVNVYGHPRLKELTEKEVGLGWIDLVSNPDPDKRVTQAAGQSLSSREIAVVKQAADAWEAVDKVLAIKGDGK
jgi:hypothetical protein